MTHAIQAHDLVKTFRGGVRGLDGLSITVPQGTVLGLLGPNGAGKTTAVRVLTTLLRPDSGTATVGGFDVVREAAMVRAVIGLTGQYAAVDELLSGRENLYLIGRLSGMASSAARERAEELLATFALEHAASQTVKTYSGGMRRRLDVAASLVIRPRILFLDEPTTGLDPRSRGGLWDMIRDLVAQGTAVLLTTQYLDEADRLADNIAVVDHGRVVASGSPDELKHRVGGQRLEVRPSSARDVETTREVIAAVTGATVSVDTDDQLVSAPVNDASPVPEVLNRLAERGVPVSSVALRPP
ncbi:MAG TPA: ATP-binding cassette domain-containing protein, partial [Micromonosporaceae bacterium]